MLNKRMKRITPVIVEAGEAARDMIADNWLKGRGGDGKTLQSPKININYRRYKLAQTGRGNIDMYLTGQMINSFHSKKESKNVAKITVNRSNMRKLEGNYDIRNAIMKVSKKISKRVADIVFAYLAR